MIPKQLTETLRLISNEVDALGSEIQAGEPLPRSVTLRDRLSSLLKRRLYRFLWWYGHQIRTVVALMARLSREEINVIEALSQGTSVESIREMQQAVLDCKRQVQVSRVQAQAEYDSLRQEIIEVKDALRQAEARFIDQGLSENGRFAKKLDEVARRLEAEAARQEQTVNRLDTEAARVSELGLFTYQTRTGLSIQDRRLTLFLEEARKRLPEPLTQDQLKDLTNHDAQHRYDWLYSAFEDVFRGSREDIKVRQGVYLPFLKEQGIGSPAMPVLDLGCGRGEWLEVLGEHGLQARGVDGNGTMVERCQSLGLTVLQNEALSYLGSLPDACMGAVTSFHMVEHMPFDVIMTLIDESLRVLKPGGILILETPNPANILVGAYTFHFDPTHLKPLPSPLLRFAVEARGFCNVHVRELHPYPEAVRFVDGTQDIAGRLNDYLYGPQDYAVIGTKAFATNG